jgi:hypothetical protein
MWGSYQQVFFYMGLSRFLRWSGRFGKRKVTWLVPELEPRLVQPSRYSECSFPRTAWHKIFQLYWCAFSWSQDYKVLYISRTILQFVPIVTKYFLHNPTLCTHCHKVRPTQSYSLYPLSQNTFCTILHFVHIVTKYVLHNPTVCPHCHKTLPARSCSLSSLSQNTSCRYYYGLFRPRS